MSHDSFNNSPTELRIPSEAAAGKQVIDDLLAALKDSGWDESDVFGVHLAVEEALVNAIKHGNQYDENKSVVVSFQISPKYFFIQITDEGSGFDPEQVPDPTADENLEMPSGRGLMLMNSFMTMVEFNERGNSVRMEKKLGEAEADAEA